MGIWAPCWPSMSFETSRILWGFATLATALLPGAAPAHLAGVPTIAWFEAPREVGIVVDESYTFQWTDYDDTDGVVGNTRIDFFFSPTMPPTYRMGSVPSALVGTPIAKGIPESDLENAWVWDTSEVPAGTYFLWSMAHDAPFRMVAFARGTVTVAHPGDPIHPAIAVTDPDGDGHVATGSYVIRYEVLDPDGSATVRLEATTSPVGADRILLAEGLDPATGSFEWDTSELEPGDWSIFARIEDARGLSHEAWGRFFVRVNDEGPGVGGSDAEGGGGGGGGGDSGGNGGDGDGAGGDAGVQGGVVAVGCSCSNGGSAWPLSPLVALALLWRRKRHPGGADLSQP